MLEAVLRHGESPVVVDSLPGTGKTGIRDALRQVGTPVATTRAAVHWPMFKVLPARCGEAVGAAELGAPDLTGRQIDTPPGERNGAELRATLARALTTYGPATTTRWRVHHAHNPDGSALMTSNRGALGVWRNPGKTLSFGNKHDLYVTGVDIGPVFNRFPYLELSGQPATAQPTSPQVLVGTVAYWLTPTRVRVDGPTGAGASQHRQPADRPRMDEIQAFDIHTADPLAVRVTGAARYTRHPDWEDMAFEWTFRDPADLLAFQQMLAVPYGSPLAMRIDGHIDLNNLCLPIGAIRIIGKNASRDPNDLAAINTLVESWAPDVTDDDLHDGYAAAFLNLRPAGRARMHAEVRRACQHVPRPV